MEFLKANLLVTSTQIAVNNNTLTADNMINRDPIYQYVTDGLNSDTSTAVSVIEITFDATTPVSRIGLIDINYKEFRLFYNGATANSFALVGGDTTSSVYTGNLDGNKYFRFNTVMCTSITINATKTITANEEKRLGNLSISDHVLTLEKIPSANAYKPKIVPKQVLHKLSDGGSRLHSISKKWETTLDLDYVTTAQRDSLFEDIYEMGEAFTFVPFGTVTSWDALLYECIWDGPFTFYEYSDNAIDSGFSGKISLKETPF